MKTTNQFTSVWPHLWRRLVRRASRAAMEKRPGPPDALLGRLGEEAAYWYLREKKNFVMVARNYRPEGLRGEIDLIGWDRDVLVFVEVKTRRQSSAVTPESAVDQDKERNMIEAARQYRGRANVLSSPYRFDIVSVVPRGGSDSGPSAQSMTFEHFQDAFRERDSARGNG